MTPGTFNVAGITFNSGHPAYTINPATLGTNGFTLTGNFADNSSRAETINDALSLNGAANLHHGRRRRQYYVGRQRQR